jgi:hypothetical protein
MVEIIFAALVSFFGIVLLSTHLEPHTMRRIVGYCGWVDLALHSTVILLFMGTSTMGLIQAELCAIMFSLALRWYRHRHGYERMTARGWVRYAGTAT